MTALCGAAGNFTQLAMARIGVGVGEAGATPPIHSMIADYFSREERTTAIGIYSLGIPLGVVFGFLAGGWIASELNWRWAFVLVGLPGLLFAPLVKLTVREPVRGAADKRDAASASADGAPQPAAAIPVRDAFKILWGIKSFPGGGLCRSAVHVLWIRVHDVDRGLLVPRARGPIRRYHRAFGRGARTWRRAWHLSWRRFGRPLRVQQYPRLHDFTGARPVVRIAIQARVILDAVVDLLLRCAVSRCCSGRFSPLRRFSLWFKTCRPCPVRAFSSAFYLFIINAFGFGLGPLFMGIVSDALAPHVGGGQALRWALTMLIPIWALGSLILWRGRDQLVTDLNAREADGS